MSRPFGARVSRAGLYVLFFSVPLSITGMQAGLGLALAGLIWHITAEDGVFRKTSFDVPLLLFAGLTLLSALMSRDPAAGLKQSFGLWTAGALYLMVHCGRKEDELRPLLTTLYVPAMAVALYAVFQHLVGTDFIRPGSPLQSLVIAGKTVYFPRGAFNHYQTFSNVFFLLFALSLSLAVHDRESRQSRLWRASAVVLGVVMVMTYTRGIWAASILALVLTALFSFSLRRAAGVIAAACAVTVLVFAFAGPGLTERGKSMFFREQNIERLMLWETTWNMIRDNARAGVGVGNYQKAQDEYIRRAVAMEMTRSHSHNNLLQVTAERGIFGLYIFLWIWYLIVKKGFYVLWRLRGRGGLSYGAVLGCLAGLTGFFADGLFQNNFGDTEAVILFWTLTGIISMTDDGVRT